MASKSETMTNKVLRQTHTTLWSRFLKQRPNKKCS